MSGLLSLYSVPGRKMEEILLEDFSKFMKDQKGVGSNSCGFSEGKSCLTNLVSFCEEVTGSVGKWSDTGWAVPCFSETFDIPLWVHTHAHLNTHRGVHTYRHEHTQIFTHTQSHKHRNNHTCGLVYTQRVTQRCALLKTQVHTCFQRNPCADTGLATPPYHDPAMSVGQE